MPSQQKKNVGISLSILIGLSTGQAFAGAFMFQNPAIWNVGDPGSTFQEWEASSAAFSASGTLASDSNVNPTIISPSTMSLGSPGFVASSGGYYALNGNYLVSTGIFNHGGSSGSGGPYSANSGTRVFVQTAATMNGGDSIFSDQLEIVTLSGAPIAGGENQHKLQLTQLFLGDVLTPFGIFPQQELLFEFWLPGYTDDFQVRSTSIVHSSFLHIRIDSLISEAESEGDFDQDNDVDGNDFLSWQRDLGSFGGAQGLDAWEQAYGTSNQFTLASISLPEPALLTMLLGATVGLCVTRVPRQREAHLTLRNSLHVQ